MTPPPRLHLARLPTPLEPLPRLSRLLGVDLRVKRDDLTGSHLSGNKVRKLDYLLADAQREGATHVITCGGLQSNHCRATALAATSLGMTPVLLLRTPTGRRDLLPSPTGNYLLDRLTGAEVHPTHAGGYAARDGIMADLAADVGDRGGVAYVVPEGGSNALGALGYVDAAAELLAQCEDAVPDTVVVATGSGGTLAGLALGLAASGVHTRALGVAVCDDRATFRAIVDRIAADAHSRFGTPVLDAERYDVIEGFAGRGYGLATPEELTFLRDTARADGLVLDPVYTNKAFRALVTLLSRPDHGLGQRIVFIHTGGLMGLLAEAESLTSVLV